MNWKLFAVACGVVTIYLIGGYIECELSEFMEFFEANCYK